MQDFIIILLICSVTMSALALSYMAVTPFLARRYSRKDQYYAWLIVVIDFHPGDYQNSTQRFSDSLPCWNLN